MTARRRFFAKITALAMGATGLTACDRETETALSPQGLDRQLLDAFVDTIVPKDQDAGAVEAGVSEELLATFAKKEDEKERTKDMLLIIDRTANRKYSTGFRNLTLRQREKVLDTVTHSRDKADHQARNTIQRLRGRIIRAFYLSPAGWAMLGYTAPFPGGYPDYSSPPA